MIDRAVVVGCGSIGQRHIRNLLALGVGEVRVVDPSEERRREAVGCGAVAAESLARALEWRPGAVLICTPPHLHVSAASYAVATGAHVFVEKPIGTVLDGVDALLAQTAAADRLIVVGYNLRFHAGIRTLKTLLDSGEIGRLLALRAEYGQHLADWRAGRDYRAGYNAFLDQGGGIVLDGSHEIDYARWLAGEVVDVLAMTAKVGDLEVEAEDVGLLTFRFASGALGQIHLDSVQRGYTRSCKLIGSTGTLIWEYCSGVKLLRADGSEKVIPISPDPNEMYMEEMRHFLKCVRGENRPCVTGADGRRVLEIALAARQASAGQHEVHVG